MTRSKPRETTSSPRFARGLAFLSCIGVLAALAVNRLCNPAGGETTRAMADSEIPEPVPQSAETAVRPCAPVHIPSDRAMLWCQTFAGIEAEADDERREEMWANLAARVALSDIPATLDELACLGHGGSEYFQRLLRRWTAADACVAATWAGQLPAGEAREAAMSCAAIEWANRDLNAAAAWARQLPATSEQQRLLLAISAEAVRDNPMEALRIAVELPADDPRDETIRRAAMEWTMRDAVSAVDWAKRIPDPSLRSQVLAAEVTAWADAAPEAAATLALESLPSGRLLNDTVVAVVQRWAQHQPELAAAWVERFPDGELRDWAVENLLAQCSQAP